MPLKSTVQRRFIKGIGATFPKLLIPPGFVPRLSNLLFTDRGGLKTCDGSKIISLLNGVLQTHEGPWTELFLFQPANVNRYYIGIKKATNKILGAPTGLAVADGGAGGTLANAIYRYEVTAIDGVGGETNASNEASFANPGAHKANLTWNPVTNAVGYNVYRTAPGGGPGTEVFLTKVTTNSFTDDNSITPGTSQPSSIDTTQQCVLYQIPATSYGDANIITLLPADFVVNVDGTPGGGGGGGGGRGGGGSSGSPPNPSGGSVGNITPIPQIVQFANKAVLALGNAFNPLLVTDGTPPTSATITNTFTATYPDWLANTAFNIGDKIKPSAGNAGGFVFTAIQAGISGGGAPTWPQTQDQTVTDNKVIWQNTGVTTSSPAPRGAVHAEVYAGSLWLANTSPTTTTDQLDGPTVVKMSDLNNPNSWNPLNIAFIGRDDGDYLTGLKAFTVAAEGIAPTGSLLAFKNFKTYQIVGVFGAPDFAIQETQSDMGCIASRTIQFLPGFGIVRLTHLGIAIFDGVRDRLISEEIRPYLFIASSQDTQPGLQALDMNFAYFAKAAQCADPPMYMLAIPLILPPISGVSTSVVAGGGSFPANLPLYLVVTKLTTAGEVAISPSMTVQTGTTANPSIQVTIPADPTATGFRVYIAETTVQFAQFAVVQSGTTTFHSFADFPTGGAPAVGTGGLTRLLCYDLVLKAWTIIDLPWPISVLRQFRAVGTEPITVTGGFLDASVRRLQLNDPDWDGTPINWLVTSAEVFGKAASARVFYRKVTIRGTTTQANLAINSVVNLDGTDGVQTPVAIYTQGNLTGTFDFLAQVDIGSTNYNSHITLSGSGNVEITSIDWETAPLREGLPPVV